MSFGYQILGFGAGGGPALALTDYALIAGGGGGGDNDADGTLGSAGGAGGMRVSYPGSPLSGAAQLEILVGEQNTITVGSGGGPGVAGGNSSIGSYAASTGGGDGGPGANGNPGGSGAGTKTGNAGGYTPPEGQDGGTWLGNNYGGGGGGAGGAGSAQTGGTGAPEGVIPSPGSGTTTTGGGGGGGSASAPSGAGSNGGGSGGGRYNAGSSASTRGSGGGGRGQDGYNRGVNGGSGSTGVVIVRVPGDYTIPGPNSPNGSVATAPNGDQVITYTSTGALQIDK